MTCLKLSLSSILLCVGSGMQMSVDSFGHAEGLNAAGHEATLSIEEYMVGSDGGVDDCSGKGVAGDVHSLTVDGKVRCFTLYTPAVADSTPMPVVVYFHGKGGKARNECNARDEKVKHADAFGYALVCGDAYVDWQFPKIGDELGVSSEKPRPCDAIDTPDVDYVNGTGGILKTLQALDKYDSDKIYFMGFSQGAMMTAWASTCFAGQIRGAVQAGSGLKLHGTAVTEKWCAQSSNSKCEVGNTDGVNIPGGAGKCEQCEYFPIQPARLTNVVGEPLRWCLYAGCKDYLIDSVYAMDEFLTSIDVPHSLTLYDDTHKAPTNWMSKVTQCHGWTNLPEGTPAVDETQWLQSCAGSDGDGDSGDPSPAPNPKPNPGRRCPTFCTTNLTAAKACQKPFCANNEHCAELNCKDTTLTSTTIVTTGSPSTECKGWCSNNAKDWTTKCEWKTCTGCSECV